MYTYGLVKKCVGSYILLNTQIKVLIVYLKDVAVIDIQATKIIIASLHVVVVAAISMALTYKCAKAVGTVGTVGTVELLQRPARSVKREAVVGARPSSGRDSSLSNTSHLISLH